MLVWLKAHAEYKSVTNLLLGGVAGAVMIVDKTVKWAIKIQIGYRDTHVVTGMLEHLMIFYNENESGEAF